MKFKSINVYTGYAEMSLNSVEEFEAPSLEEAIKQEHNKTLAMIKADGDGIDIQFFEHCWLDTKHNCGMVDAGEEGYDLIVPEGHEWYNIITSAESLDHDNCSDEVFEKWKEFNSSLSSEMWGGLTMQTPLQ